MTESSDYGEAANSEADVSSELVREPTQEGQVSQPGAKFHVSGLFQGPFPPPNILKGYYEIDPGIVERVFDYAEKVRKHREECERQHLAQRNRLIESQISNSKRGQWHGLIIGLACLSVVVIISLFAPPDVARIVGSVLGASGIAGLAGVYIYGGSRREKELPRQHEDKSGTDRPPHSQD